MDDKQKSLLNNSLRAFDGIRASMNDSSRKGSVPFELRGKQNMRYNLSPNSKEVTISRYNEGLYNEMEALLKLDDSEWQEALGENANVAEAKAKLITLVNVIIKQRNLGEPHKGGEDFYKEPEQGEQDQQGQGGQDQGEQGKDEPKEKVVYKFGVKKDVLKAKIDTYQKIIDQKTPVSKSNRPNVTPKKRDVEKDLLNLYKELADKNSDLEKIQNDKTSKTRTQDIAKMKDSIEKLQKRIDKYTSRYGDVLDYTFIVQELKNLIEQSKFETFVEMDSIQKQIEFYEGVLSGSNIDKDALSKRKDELTKEIDEDSKKLSELQKQLESAKTTKELTLTDKAGMLKTLKEFRDIQSKKLNTNQKNHYKDLVDKLDKKINELEQESGISDELDKIEKIQDRKMSSSEKNAILKTLEEIRKSFSNSKGNVNGKVSMGVASLNAEIKRLRSATVEKPANTEKIEKEIDSVKVGIEQKQKEIEDIDKKLQFKQQVPEADQKLQKRSIEARLKELKELSKDRELFKITDKGEVVINYPEMKLSDEDKKQIQMGILENAKKQIGSANDLMVKEFYGHKETKTAFDEIMDKLYDPENRVMKKATKYVNGKPVEYEYEGIKDYEGRDEDLASIKMSDYVLIFERVEKAKNGDLSDYEKMPDGLKQYEKDVEYLESNNGKYDRVATTIKNLKTLGKYGEKVEYSSFKQGQPVRNAFRGVGNALKFVRNHTTAPMYNFIGDKVVSPIYKRIHKDEEGKSRGSFENKPLHRYLARREYYESQGKGFLSSRFNAIFNASKGNQALLNAGSHEITEFYRDASRKMIIQKIQEKEAELKLQAIEIRRKDISEQIEMLVEAIETVKDPEDKKRYSDILADFRKAEAQIKKDTEQEKTKSEQAKAHVSMDVRYDTIDMDQHDKANKDTITKSVTAIKGVAKLGIRHFVAPKIKNWLLEKSKQEIEVQQEGFEEVSRQNFVPTTYKEVKEPVFETQYDHNISMKDLMSKNAGKEVEGFYSVYGGEKAPQMYTLSGNEKVTAVFQSVGNKGTGFADTAGLTAPTLVDKTFDSSLLEGSGVLGQNVTLDKLIEMIGDGKVNPETLEGMYLSLDDKAWFDVSDLYKVASKQVQVGEVTKQVVDKAGHWETVVDKIPKVETVKKIVENTRITKLIKALGIAGKTTLAASDLEDIYENTRETDTEVEHTKPDPRDFSAVEIKVGNEVKEKYTGKRKADLDEER